MNQYTKKEAINYLQYTYTKKSGGMISINRNSEIEWSNSVDKFKQTLHFEQCPTDVPDTV